MGENNRFIELDIIRGFAIIAMIFFHLLWDLDFYQVYPLNNTIYQLNKIIACMFLFIVGVSLSIEMTRKTPLQQLKRGLWIFNVGEGIGIHANWSIITLNNISDNIGDRCIRRPTKRRTAQ